MKSSPPHNAPRSHLTTKPPPSRTLSFGLLLRVFLLFGGRLRPRSVFFILFSSLKSLSNTTGNCPPQTFRHGRILFKIPASLLALFLVGCCVVSARGGCLRPRPGRSLYFFVALFAAPNDRKKSSPRVPSRSRLINNASPTPPPTFGWLLCLLTNGGHLRLRDTGV